MKDKTDIMRDLIAGAAIYAFTPLALSLGLPMTSMGLDALALLYTGPALGRLFRMWWWNGRNPR